MYTTCTIISNKIKIDIVLFSIYFCKIDNIYKKLKHLAPLTKIFVVPKSCK